MKVSTIPAVQTVAADERENCEMYAFLSENLRLFFSSFFRLGMFPVSLKLLLDGRLAVHQLILS